MTLFGFLKSARRKAEYIGQCDSLRRRGGAEAEANWQRMMKLAEPVTHRSFLRHVDISVLLDADETPEEYLRGLPVFKSKWGPRNCWFIADAGFEFIFATP